MLPVVKNWSGGISFSPQSLLYPSSESEIQSIIQQAASAGRGVRVVGAAHSFTPLIVSPDILLSLDQYQGIERIDLDRECVWVKAGTRLARLNSELSQYGLALANLGDIDHQSIAGAISTGTHGTGSTLGNLPSQVLGLRLVCADGTIQTLDSSHPHLAAAQISLGTLGVISAVALKVLPRYRLRLQLSRAKLEDVLAQLPELLGQHRHVEFFVFPGSPFVQLKLSDISQAEPTPRVLNLLNELLLENMGFVALCEMGKRFPRLTPQLAQISGRAISSQIQVDESWRIFCNQRWARFEEMEYAVPRFAFEERLRALLSEIAAARIPVSFPIECRFAAGDEAWLSPAYQRDVAYIAVHQYKGMPYQDYFKRAERLFLAVQGRPHWGKRHFLQAEDFSLLYPQWSAFRALRSQWDPQGMFLNPYLRHLL